MKLLLTSAGIKNASIHDALVDLLGKSIPESSALCIPTASYGHPMAGPGSAWRFIAGQEPRTPMCELGWKSLGVLELTALGETPLSVCRPDERRLRHIRCHADVDDGRRLRRVVTSCRRALSATAADEYGCNEPAHA